MNFLDRAIAAVAPERGLRRAAARAAISTIAASGYDGATVGRRTSGWFASSGSANAVIKGPLPRLRARARDLTRNTWWGSRVKSVTRIHSVGTGIAPMFKTGNKSLDKRAARLWAAWGRRCDTEGQLSINGLLALAVDCIVESGETLARVKPVTFDQRGIVPLELQLFEPDHLSSSRDMVLPDVVIDQGIEYDIATGKRLAYWMLPQHPGSITTGFNNTLPVRIEARDMLHVYRKDRIGQGRGVPWLAPVILKGRDVADLEEAVVVKSRIEACLSAFVTSTNTSRTLSDQAQMEKRAASQRRIEQLAPGMIVYGEPGESVTAIQPSSSVQFDSVLMANWLCLAAGAGITYNQLTGDLRQANYSSMRAGTIEFRRLIEQFQYLTIADMLLEPLADRWTEVAQDAGLLPRRVGGYPREWIFPAWEPIDPLKDLQADILAVRSGRMTWDHFVSSWGFDPADQIDQIAEWLKLLDAKGIVLDTDPRRAFKSVKSNSSTDTGIDNPVEPAPQD
jgi:lambda family phage portal protein